MISYVSSKNASIMFVGINRTTVPTIAVSVALECIARSTRCATGTSPTIGLYMIAT